MRSTCICIFSTTAGLRSGCWRFFTVHHYGISLPEKGSRWFVGLMSGACVPAYALSLLWTNPSGWVWTLAAGAGLAQWTALVILVVLLWRSRRKWGLLLSRPVKILWGMSFIAFGIKITLQALSVIPFLGQLAFGYRPVIIAYLHLVMLCFVSFFIVGFLIQGGIGRLKGPVDRAGLWIWVTGVIGNEVALLAQSVLALTGHVWPASPYYLFGAALMILAGLAAVFVGQAGHGRKASPPESFPRLTVVRPG